MNVTLLILNIFEPENIILQALNSNPKLRIININKKDRSMLLANDDNFIIIKTLLRTLKKIKIKKIIKTASKNVNKILKLKNVIYIGYAASFYYAPGTFFIPNLFGKAQFKRGQLILSDDLIYYNNPVLPIARDIKGLTFLKAGNYSFNKGLARQVFVNDNKHRLNITVIKNKLTKKQHTFTKLPLYTTEEDYKRIYQHLLIILSETMDLADEQSYILIKSCLKQGISPGVILLNIESLLEYADINPEAKIQNLEINLLGQMIDIILK